MIYSRILELTNKPTTDKLIRQKLNTYEKNGGQLLPSTDPDIKTVLEHTDRIFAVDRPEMADLLMDRVKERGAPASEEAIATYKQREEYDKDCKQENNWGKWQVCGGDPAAHRAYSPAHDPSSPEDVKVSFVERDDPDYPTDRLRPGEPDDVCVNYRKVIDSQVTADHSLPAAGSADRKRVPRSPSSIPNLPKSEIPNRVLTMLKREQQFAKEFAEDDDGVFYPPGGKHPPQSPPKPIEPFIKRPYSNYDKPVTAVTTPVAATTVTTAQIQARGSSSHIRAQSSGSVMQLTPTPAPLRARRFNQSFQNDASLASSPSAKNKSIEPTKPRQTGKPPIIRGASNLRPETPAFSLTPVADASSGPALTNNFLPLLFGGYGSSAAAANIALEASIASSKLIADEGNEPLMDTARVEFDECLLGNNLNNGRSLNPNASNFKYHTGGTLVAELGPGRVGGSHAGANNAFEGNMGVISGSDFGSGFGAASLGENNIGMGNLSGLLTDLYHHDSRATSNHNLFHHHPAPGSYLHPKDRPRRFQNNGQPYSGHAANHSFDNTAYTSQGMNHPAIFTSNILNPISVASQQAAHGSAAGTAHGHSTTDFGRGQTYDFNFPGGNFNNQNQRQY